MESGWMLFPPCLNSIIHGEHGQWEPNEHGGDGNLEAIAFISDLNATIYRDFPDVQTIQMKKQPTGPV